MIRTNRLKVSAGLGTLVLALGLALAAVVLALVANPALAITTIKVTTKTDEYNTTGTAPYARRSSRRTSTRGSTAARREAGRTP